MENENIKDKEIQGKEMQILDKFEKIIWEYIRALDHVFDEMSEEELDEAIIILKTYMEEITGASFYDYVLSAWKSNKTFRIMLKEATEYQKMTGNSNNCFFYQEDCSYENHEKREKEVSEKKQMLALSYDI